MEHEHNHEHDHAHGDQHDHDHGHHNHRHFAMQTDIKEVSAVKRQIKVTIEAKEFQQEFETTLNKFQKKAVLKGFRQGKAPIDMVRRNFKDEIEKEAVGELIRESLHTIISHEALQPLDYPVLESRNLDASGKVEYTVTVEVKPTLKVNGYKSLKLTKDSKQPGEQEVQNVIERLRDQHATQVDKSSQGTVPAADDYVSITAELKINGKSVDKVKVTDRVVPLGQKYLLPELEAALLTMKPGETKQVDIIFDSSYGDKALAGKKGVFDLTLNGLKEKRLPELNDDFAKTTGEADTFAELKANIAKRLQEENEQNEKRELEQQALEQIGSANPFEVPASLVKHRFDYLMNQWTQRGLRVNTEAEAQKIQNECYNISMQEVRNDLLIEAIAKQEKIEVAESDVNAKIEAMLTPKSGTTEPADNERLAQMREFFQSDERRAMLQEQLLRTKTLDFILGNATIKAK